MSLKITSLSPPTFLFFKVVLALLGLSHFHVSLRKSLSVSKKKKIYIYIYIKQKQTKKPRLPSLDWDCIESMDQFGENKHLNTVDSSDLRT